MSAPEDDSRKLQIVRIGESASSRGTDHMRTLRSLVLESQEMYPGIHRWFDGKVVDGLRRGERAAFVGYASEKPIVSAIIKRGKHAKFCHLRIRDEDQKTNLGELFFTLMTFEVGSEATDIHFTLPESLWERERGFFGSFGFGQATPASRQYRLFEQEVRCTAPIGRIVRTIYRKLTKVGETFQYSGGAESRKLVMSIRPEFASKVLQGVKRVEVRRRFSYRWSGARVTLYATSPVRALVGDVKIARVVKGSPESLWREYGGATGCTKAEFDEYSHGAEELMLLFLENPRPYLSPMPLPRLAQILDEKVRPPVSYCSVDPEDRWSRALTLASLIQAEFTRVAMPERVDRLLGGKGDL